MTNPKRVHVTWEDSARIILGWAPRSDYVKATPTIVRTVGWLLKANRRRRRRHYVERAAVLRLLGDPRRP